MLTPRDVAGLLDESKREYTRLKLRAAGLRTQGQDVEAAEVAIVVYRLEGAINAFETVLREQLVDSPREVIEGEVVRRELPDQSS